MWRGRALGSGGRARRAAVIAEIDLGRVAESQTVRRDVGNHHAVGADNGAFTDRDAFHNMTAVADPGIAADPDGADVAGIKGSVPGTEVGFARVAVAIRYTTVERNSRIFFDHHLIVNGEIHAPTDLRAILDNQPGMIVEPSGSYRHAADRHPIPNVQFDVTAYEGQSPNGEVPAERRAAGLEQRMRVKNVHKPVNQPDRAEVNLIEDPEKGLQEAGDPRGLRVKNRLKEPADQPICRSLTAPHPFNEVVDGHGITNTS